MIERVKNKRRWNFVQDVVTKLRTEIVLPRAPRTTVRHGTLPSWIFRSNNIGIQLIQIICIQLIKLNICTLSVIFFDLFFNKITI